MVFGIIRRELFSLFQKRARFAFAADADGPVRRVAIQQTKTALRPGEIKLSVEIRRRFEFAFHFPDEPQRADEFRACELAGIHRQIIMRGCGIGLARDELAARGDALSCNRSASGVVRREVREIETGAGKLPCVGGIVFVRLKLFLRAVKFRFRAGGENFILRLARKNDSGRGENKNRRRKFTFGFAPDPGIKSCHRAVLFYTQLVRLNWNFLCLAMFVALALFSAGCGGINASQSVSPASFFLPGLLKNDAPTNAPVLIPEISQELASVK